MKEYFNFKKIGANGAKSFFYGALFAVGIAVTALIAQTATAWTSGETITATKINAIVTDLGTLFGDARWSKNGANAYYTAGNVGIGTTTPGSTLTVRGTGMRFEAAEGTPRFTVSGDDATGAQMILNDDAGNNMVALHGRTGWSNYINNGGNFGIGTASPSAKLNVYDTTTTSSYNIALFGDGTAAIKMKRLFTSSWGLSLPSAGTDRILFMDNAGVLKYAPHTAIPANNTGGTVVGTQTSTRDTKESIRDYSDTNILLQKLIKTQLHTFLYKHEAKGYGKDAKRKLGFIADEVDPLFMGAFGKSIDQVSVNGIFIGSIQEQQKIIKQLKNENQSLRDDMKKLRRNTAARLQRIEIALGKKLPKSTLVAAVDVKPVAVANKGILRRFISYIW